MDGLPLWAARAADGRSGADEVGTDGAVADAARGDTLLAVDIGLFSLQNGLSHNDDVLGLNIVFLS